MSKSPRVRNITRGFSLRFNQAVRAVEVCSCAWVEYGVSVRDVTLAEAIELRNQQAARRPLLDYAELPWLVYVPSASAPGSGRAERKLAVEANIFAQEATRVYPKPA